MIYILDNANVFHVLSKINKNYNFAIFQPS